jgi:hypothetical protein
VRSDRETGLLKHVREKPGISVSEKPVVRVGDEDEELYRAGGCSGVWCCGRYIEAHLINSNTT